MMALHFTCGGLLEALGSAFVCFQFRHKSSKTAVSIQHSAFTDQIVTGSASEAMGLNADG